jgi:hypothetical protein
MSVPMIHVIPYDSPRLPHILSAHPAKGMKNELEVYSLVVSIGLRLQF